MKTLRSMRQPLPVAVALVLATSGTAYAQSTGDACQDLAQFMANAEGELRAAFTDADEVATTNDEAVCAEYLQRVSDAGGESSESLSETVKVEQAATIEGEVQVSLPDPDVSVEQAPAEVSVATEPPDVSVTQAQPTIVIRQAKPIVRVQLAQPTITVEQPAPEIRITMPDPEINVASAQPTVDVVIPEPRVTVRQGDPQLSVDLQAEPSEGEGTTSNAAMQRSDADGIMTVQVDGVTGSAAEPNITFANSEQQANVTVEQQEPDVSYEAAEPEIIVETASDEPNIEIVQSGEPKIMFSSAADAQNAPAQKDPVQALSASGPAPENGQSESVPVGDINGMEVVNGNGEELGTVDRVVKNGNDTFVIVEHGGWFLGLNDKEIALPLADTFVQQEQVVLRGLTEEQIELLPEYSYAEEVELNEGDTVDVTRAN